MVHINPFPRNNQSLKGMQVFSFYRKKLFPTLLKIACPEVYIRVHFRTRVFAKQKHRCCVKPRTSVSVLKCTSVFILWLRVRNANSILRGTIAIRGGTDTCYRENHNCPAFILEPSLEIKRVLRAEPTLLKIGDADALLTSVRPCTLVNDEICVYHKSRYCLIPPPSVAELQSQRFCK